MVENAFKQMGEELLTFSKEDAPYTARGAVSELFPYIQHAAHRMSTRAISRWLQENHGIKIGAATIAKALREPAKHWENFGEEIETATRLLSDAYDVEEKDLLSDIDILRFLDNKVPSITASDKEASAELLAEIEDSKTVLKTRWLSLDESIRKAGLRYMLSRGE